MQSERLVPARVSTPVSGIDQGRGHIQPEGADISFFIRTVRDKRGNNHLFVRVHAYGDSGGGIGQWTRDLPAGDLWAGFALALQHDIRFGTRPRPRRGGGGASPRVM